MLIQRLPLKKRQNLGKWYSNQLDIIKQIDYVAMDCDTTSWLQNISNKIANIRQAYRHKMVISKIEIKLTPHNKRSTRDNNKITYNIRELRADNNLLTEISDNICENYITNYLNGNNLNVNEKMGHYYS